MVPLYSASDVSSEDLAFRATIRYTNGTSQSWKLIRRFAAPGGECIANNTPQVLNMYVEGGTEQCVGEPVRVVAEIADADDNAYKVKFNFENINSFAYITPGLDTYKRSYSFSTPKEHCGYVSVEDACGVGKRRHVIYGVVRRRLGLRRRWRRRRWRRRRAPHLTTTVHSSVEPGLDQVCSSIKRPGPRPVPDVPDRPPPRVAVTFVLHMRFTKITNMKMKISIPFLRAFLSILPALFMAYEMPLPAFAVTDEQYEFKQMWPLIQDKWYFSFPEGVATDDEGNVYVVDTMNSRVLKYTDKRLFLLLLGARKVPASGTLMIPRGSPWMRPLGMST